MLLDMSIWWEVWAISGMLISSFIIRQRFRIMSFVVVLMVANWMLVVYIWKPYLIKVKFVTHELFVRHLEILKTQADMSIMLLCCHIWCLWFVIHNIVKVCFLYELLMQIEIIVFERKHLVLLALLNLIIQINVFVKMVLIWRWLVLYYIWSNIRIKMRYLWIPFIRLMLSCRVSSCWLSRNINLVQHWFAWLWRESLLFFARLMSFYLAISTCCFVSSISIVDIWTLILLLYDTIEIVAESKVHFLCVL